MIRTDSPVMPGRKPSGGMPLARTLMLWFLLVALFACVTVGVLTYYNRAEAMRQTIFAKLELLRDGSIVDVNLWTAERLADVDLWAEAPTVVDACEQHAKGMPLDEKFPPPLGAIRSRYAYHAVFIADPTTGVSILSFTQNGGETPVLNEPHLGQVVREGRSIISDVQLDPVSGRPFVVFAVPVRAGGNGQITGALVFQEDMTVAMYPRLIRSGRFDETGDVLLVNSHGLVQSPPRFRENAVGKLTIAAEPAKRAASGQTGRIADVDYRSVPVMAAYGHIPDTGWGLVVKQDMAEINAPVARMARNISFISLAVLLVAGLIGLFLARFIARPADAIAAVAEQIGSGDSAARAEDAGPCEIRRVARNLNQMVERLSEHARVDRALTDIYAAASAQNRVQMLLNDVVPRLMDTTRSQAAVVYLAEGNGGTFRRERVHGVDSDRLPVQITREPPDTLMSEAVASGRILVHNDIPPGHKLILRTAAGETPPRAMMCIPLIRSGRPVGVIGLASLYDYRNEDRRVAEALSLNLGQSVAVCLATEEAERLNEELRSANEELLANNEELQSQAEELQATTEELKQQAEELEAQRLEVLEADRLKSEFLSNMSHELRTPLNSIMALSQLMITRGVGKNPDQDANYLRIVERNGRQLLNLINDILDLSKIESGRVDFDRHEFASQDVLRAAADVARPLADAKGIPLVLKVAESPLMSSDEGRVRQILVNLLSNAVKFTESGQIEAVVSADDDKVLFTVTDTGIGIAPADQVHIFDEFRQVDGSTTRRHEGTGLGLAICRKLARLLGGDVKVDSDLGRGSTFTLALPVRAPAPPRTPRVAPLKIAGAESMSARARPGRRILVIDDDPAVCRMIQDYLVSAGYEVATASNGREGMELARQWRPFAITLDLLMPGMDGWETLREIKADPATKNIPVTVLSVSEDRATGVALGAAGYLAKPVDRNVLLAEVRRLAAIQPIRRILVVDDDPIVLRQLEAMLRDAGYHVLTAAGGEEAIRVATADVLDAIILDLMMPDVDGFAVLHRLREGWSTRDIPVIILTAKDLTDREKQELAQATRRVITKGAMDQNRLLREIRQVIVELDRSRPAAPDGERPTVLVVEDNEVAALQIKSALEESGYTVTTASGGQEAILRVREAVPDAILLDLMMPGMDGFEVLDQVRSTPQTAQIPVLILTAKELTAADRARLTHNNIQQLVQKGSLDRDELVACVDRLIARPAEPVAQPAASPPPARPAPVRSERAGEVVLVVEDNQDNLLTIAAILDEIGCKYRTARNGREAVELTRELRPRLVLMDMQLPELGGEDATRAIRSDPSVAAVPIIAITAKAMKGDREKILACGCDEYLSKPLDPAEVMEVVRRWT